MGHLTLVTSSTPIRTSRTDTRLLKICRQYLLGHQHLNRLRAEQAKAQKIAAAVLRDRPDDGEAAALWQACWDTTPAGAMARGVAWNEKQQAKLLSEISETPARTEAGLRARLQVWRSVLAVDDADRLLDAIVADTSKRKA